jgi:hypothetical protein
VLYVSCIIVINLGSMSAALPGLGTAELHLQLRMEHQLKLDLTSYKTIEYSIFKAINPLHKAKLLSKHLMHLAPCLTLHQAVISQAAQPGYLSFPRNHAFPCVAMPIHTHAYTGSVTPYRVSTEIKKGIGGKQSSTCRDRRWGRRRRGAGSRSRDRCHVGHWGGRLSWCLSHRLRCRRCSVCGLRLRCG